MQGSGCRVHRAVEELQVEGGREREDLYREVRKNNHVQRFRGGLVFKAQRLLYHSTLGSSVIKKEERTVVRQLFWSLRWCGCGTTISPSSRSRIRATICRAMVVPRNVVSMARRERRRAASDLPARSGFRVQGAGCRVHGAWCRVQGSEFGLSRRRNTGRCTLLRREWVTWRLSSRSPTWRRGQSCQTPVW